MVSQCSLCYVNEIHVSLLGRESGRMEAEPCQQTHVVYLPLSGAGDDLNSVALYVPRRRAVSSMLTLLVFKNERKRGEEERDAHVSPVTFGRGPCHRVLALELVGLRESPVAVRISLSRGKGCSVENLERRRRRESELGSDVSSDGREEGEGRTSKENG